MNETSTSTGMDDCPICERRVLTTNGICSACSTDLCNESDVQRRVLKRKASSIAMTARANGASFGEIETELIKGGVGQDLIKEIMIQVEGKTSEALAEKKEFDMRHGFYWLLGGILVSVVTYMIASASENGGVYVIAYGAVIAGGIQFLRGLLGSNGKK